MANEAHEPAPPTTWLARCRRVLAHAGTLRVRLTIAVAIVSGAGLSAGGALLVHAVEATVVRAIEDQSRDELHDVGVALASGVELANIHVMAPGHRLSFLRPDGSMIGSFDHPTPPLLPLVAPAPKEVWSLVEVPLVSPKEGPLRAVAVRPLHDVLRSTATLQRALEVGVPALVVLLTLAGWVLIGRALKPVRVMTQDAAGIADATARERLAAPPAGDELAELARTLNGMLDRLSDAMHRQREFVSDASHELRSPIAATRTQIEVALAHPDRVEAAAALRGVLAETTRLEGLVADLLALARLDERRPVGDEEIDLDDLVLEDAARARALTIDTRGVMAVKLRGDRKSLGQLVRNLLDNAARHARSRVVVSTHLAADAAVLRVDDDGPGIPEADRARVFERFTRLSSSRSRDHGGAGLGLALVRRVAEHHGGSARADRSPEGGARLEVRFPRDPREAA